MSEPTLLFSVFLDGWKVIGGSLSNVLVEREPYIQKSIAMIDTKALLSPFHEVPIFAFLKVETSK